MEGVKQQAPKNISVKRMSRARISTNLGALLRDTRASEIAEAALVLPLMFMVLLGIFWFGQAFRIYGTLAQSARSAAVAAAAPECQTCAGTATPAQAATTAIQNAFNAAHLDTAQLPGPPVAPAGLLSCTTGGPASGCDGAVGVNICLQENVQLAPAPGGAGVCGVSVSFKYPYQFWFPGTSLNNQIIQLPGGAEAKMETQ